MTVLDLISAGHHHYHQHDHVITSSFDDSTASSLGSGNSAALVQAQSEQSFYNVEYENGTRARGGTPMSAVTSISKMSNEQYASKIVNSLKMKALGIMNPSSAQKIYANVAAIGACSHTGSNCQDIGEVAAMTMGSSAPVQNFASMAPDLFDATQQFTLGNLAAKAFGKSGGTGGLSSEIQQNFAAGKQAIIDHLSNSGSASELLMSKFSLKSFISSFGAAAAKRKGQINIYNNIYNQYYAETSGGSAMSSLSALGGGPMSSSASSYQNAANKLVMTMGTDIKSLTGEMFSSIEGMIMDHLFAIGACTGKCGDIPQLIVKQMSDTLKSGELQKMIGGGDALLAKTEASTLSSGVAITPAYKMAYAKGVASCQNGGVADMPATMSPAESKYSFFSFY